MAKIHLEEKGSMIFTPMCSRGHRLLTFDIEGFKGDEDFYLTYTGCLLKMSLKGDTPVKLFGLFKVSSVCPECGEVYRCELAFNVGILQRVSRLPGTLLDSDIMLQQELRLRAAP
jgi:hypothetical protein